MQTNLVLKNGVIETMANDKTAQAIAIKEDKIVYVGNNEGVKEYEDGAQIIDLQGKFVSPGFIDGHTHDVMYLIDEDTTFFFQTLPAIYDEYYKGFKAFVEEHPDNEMYYGNSFDMNAFPNGFVNNKWINEICPDRPVMITDMSNHCFLLNAKAMEIAGVTDDMPVPNGANFFRYPDGKLTGYFADSFFITEKLPAKVKNPEKYHKAFLKYQDICSSYGITGIDIAGPIILAQDVWQVLADMEKNGELKLRVNCTYLDWNNPPLSNESAESYIEMLTEGQKYNSDYQKVSQVKIILDGVPEAKSARLIEPYAKEANEASDYIGPMYHDPEVLKNFVTKINEAGYQVQIHAMGDGAVKVALDAYEHSQEINGDKDYRNMIAHVTLITDEDIKRMGKLKVIGTMQPLWWYYDPNFSCLEEQNFGTERFKKEYNIRTMMDAGIKITGSIDYPIQPDFRPLAGIQVGTTQSSPYKDQCDDPKYLRNADQVVTAKEMLECYTTNGAFEMRMEDSIGTLEVGKKADLVVLEQDILTCDPKTIADTKVVYTIMNGKIVYQG